MRIEKIELIGFKSFTDRTVFNLHPGITCIVGPNGCGKSNVVDAFKWVLGEQSAKSLRGDKMEEVIFTGSQTKKPKGMAEVTLTVSGLGNSGNGEGSEITTVTRRLYRSGDSDYMLNKDVCRLRDIRDIFLDTGLEVKSYSILEQDRIAAILNSRPEERRFLIEEIAGVVKYKVRRTEAQSKLESSRLNLQRINDIIAEVKRQINSLDRQVKKAERYKRLLEEVRSIECRIAKNNYTSLGESLNEIIKEYNGLKEESASISAGITKTETDIELLRITILDKEKSLNDRQAELQAREKDIADIDRSIAVLRAEKENLKEHSFRLMHDKEEVGSKIKEAGETKKELNSSMNNLLLEISSLRDELRMKNESLGIKEDELTEKEQLLEMKRKEAFKASEGLSLLKNELNMHAAVIENYMLKEKNVEAEYNESKKHLEEEAAALKALGSLTSSKENEVLSLEGQRDSLNKDLWAHKAGLEGLRASLASLREEIAAHTSRLESLKEMFTGGEPLQGIASIASVSETIDVPHEYEKAVESSLKEAINGLILPDIEDIEAAVELLKEKDIERTALIPLNTKRQLTDKQPPEGTLGRASDLIRVKEEFSHLIKNLLANIVVVKDLKTGLGINDSESCLVTLDGETIEPSGTVIAGRGKGLLRRKRQIKELDSEIRTKESRMLSIQDEISAMQTSVRETEDRLQALNDRILSADKELEALRLQSRMHMEEMARTEKKLEYLKMEAEDAKRDKESLEAVISDKDAELRQAEEAKTLIENTISGLQERLFQQKAVYEEQRSNTVDIRLSLNSCTERMDSIDKELKAIEKLEEQLGDKIELIENDSSRTELLLSDKDKGIIQNEALLKELVLKADELNREITIERQALGEKSVELQALELALKTLRTKMMPVSERLSELEVSRAEHKLRIDNLIENIKNTYGLMLEGIEAELPLPDDEERLEGLRAKIQEMGLVSLGSLDEYEELKARYEFLTKQQTDIEQSIAELEEAITRINITTRKKLKDAYESLNVKFGEIFRELFGGGMAELRLTDEGNILDTGIDIVAQPPGKRLQNITLLSGGERALTALSLLFAGFLIKPTPLCILDEADASLDEANTGKFSNMLKEVSKDTQFIVITHNKVTMETADYIYGITMEEAGSSKVISMELIDT